MQAVNVVKLYDGDGGNAQTEFILDSGGASTTPGRDLPAAEGGRAEGSSGQVCIWS